MFSPRLRTASKTEREDEKQKGCVPRAASLCSVFLCTHRREGRDGAGSKPGATRVGGVYTSSARKCTAPTPPSQHEPGVSDSVAGTEDEAVSLYQAISYHLMKRERQTFIILVSRRTFLGPPSSERRPHSKMPCGILVRSNAFTCFHPVFLLIFEFLHF